MKNTCNLLLFSALQFYSFKKMCSPTHLFFNFCLQYLLSYRKWPFVNHCFNFLHTNCSSFLLSLYFLLYIFLSLYFLLYMFLTLYFVLLLNTLFEIEEYILYWFTCCLLLSHLLALLEIYFRNCCLCFCCFCLFSYIFKTNIHILD